MINRTLVRTKIIQTLFAYFKKEEQSPMSARKELINSFSNTYSLYMMLLAFADELTTYADQQIEANKARAAVIHQEYVPNRNFVNNRIAQQLFNNRRLRTYIEDQHLRWDTGMNAVESIYKQLVQAPFYTEYMQLEQPTYEDDKRIWRKIYSTLMPENEALDSALEDMEIALDFQGWTTEVDLVITYIDKTIKRFTEQQGDNQTLLEMFNSEEELTFAKELLRLTIEHADEHVVALDAVVFKQDIGVLIFKRVRDCAVERLFFRRQLVEHHRGAVSGRGRSIRIDLFLCQKHFFAVLKQFAHRIKEHHCHRFGIFPDEKRTQ